MPSIDYRQLRSQLSMRHVLQLLGYTPLLATGDQWRGPYPLPGCPNSLPGCFPVHVSRNIYRCFQCLGQGNTLGLWAAVHKFPLHQAALDLCQRLRLHVPHLPSHPQLNNRPAPNQHSRNTW